MGDDLLVRKRLTDMVLPLIPWHLQKAMGGFLSPQTWKEVALSHVPPSETLEQVIWDEWQEMASPALLSATYRRKFRRRCRRRLDRRLSRDPSLPVLRDFLLRWRRRLEDAGHREGQGGIKKLRDIEASIREEFRALAEVPGEVIAAFPPEKVLDLRHYKAIIDETGAEGYALGVISLLEEFALRGRAQVRPRITVNSKAWELLGLDPDEMDKLSLEDGARRFLEAWMKSLRLEPGELEDGRLRRITAWVIRTHLPLILLGPGYTVRSKEVPLSTPVGEDMTLEDTLADDKVGDFADLVNARLDLRRHVNRLPLAQREAVELLLEARTSGSTLQEVCGSKGESYPAVRQALKRARESLNKTMN